LFLTDQAGEKEYICSVAPSITPQLPTGYSFDALLRRGRAAGQSKSCHRSSLRRRISARGYRVRSYKEWDMCVISDPAKRPQAPRTGQLPDGLSCARRPDRKGSPVMASFVMACSWTQVGYMAVKDISGITSHFVLWKLPKLHDPPGCRPRLGRKWISGPVN
jgi:hypothetical protein